MSSPEEVIAVIQELQRWRCVREAINQRKSEEKKLDNGALDDAIAMLLEYRRILSTGGPSNRGSGVCRNER